MKEFKDDLKAEGGIREGKTTVRTAISPGKLLKKTIISGPKKKRTIRKNL